MLRFAVIFLSLYSVVNAQLRDSAGYLITSPSGKPMRIAQFSLSSTDTNTRKPAGAISYKGGYLYLSNGTYWSRVGGTGGGGSTGNSDSLGGVPASDYARLSVANTFTDANIFKGDSVHLQRTDGSSGTGTGTITILDGSTTMSGSGTAFLSELVEGSIVTVSGQDYRVYSIANNTTATVTENATGSDITTQPFTYIGKNYSFVKYVNGLLVGQDNNSNWLDTKVTGNGFKINLSLGSMQIGSASGTQWDSVNTSNGTINFGVNNVVSGGGSSAFGAENTVSGIYSASFGNSNSTGTGSYKYLFGNSLKSSNVNYVALFGSNITAMRQTTGGFAYANSADTIRMGHGTFSWNVPFVAGNNTTAAGGVGSALILYNEASDDTSAFTLGQALGVGGSGGTTTTSFTLYKTKGTDPANNNKPDGNKYISLFAVDTSNNIIFNASKSSHFNYGNMSIANGNFTASTGNITATTGAISGATITGTSYVDGDDSVFTSSADSWMGAESGGITPRLAFVKASGFGPELRFLSSSASLFTVRRVTGGTLLAPTASTVDLLFSSTGNATFSGNITTATGTISGTILDGDSVALESTTEPSIRLTESGNSGFRLSYDGDGTNDFIIGAGTGGTFTPYLSMARANGALTLSAPQVINSGLNTIVLTLSDVTTDATAKLARFGSKHYTNSEEPVAISYSNNTTSANTLNWGGGTGLMNAATVQNWYIGATNTTTTGTLSMLLDANGLEVNNKVIADSSFTINERSTTPTLPTSNTQMHMYMKGDKVVWVINAAGTPRYYYFDASATADQQIIYSATAP